MDFRDIEKQFPGKKVVFKGGRIVLKDPPGRKGTGKTRFASIDLDKVTEMEQIALSKGKIYIPYEVMSSKNSRVFEYLYKTSERMKVPILRHSQQYQEYTILTKTYWVKNKARFHEMIRDKTPPYRIGFYFLRTTKQRFDYPNMMQGIMDLIVKNGWLADDHMELIKPYPDGYEVKKEVQGVILSVL